MDPYIEACEIPVVAAFLSEPPPLGSVPIATSVRAYLVDRCGAEWLCAAVYSFKLADGNRAHMAFVYSARGSEMRLVHERRGVLGLAEEIEMSEYE